MSLISVGKLRQEEHKFEACLGYCVSPVSKEAAAVVERLPSKGKALVRSPAPKKKKKRRRRSSSSSSSSNSSSSRGSSSSNKRASKVSQ